MGNAKSAIFKNQWLSGQLAPIESPPDSRLGMVATVGLLGALGAPFTPILVKVLDPKVYDEYTDIGEAVRNLNQEHPCVSAFLFVCENHNNPELYNLAFEYGEPIKDFLKDEPTVWAFTDQIVEGLVFLESQHYHYPFLAKKYVLFNNRGTVKLVNPYVFEGFMKDVLHNYLNPQNPISRRRDYLYKRIQTNITELGFLILSLIADINEQHLRDNPGFLHKVIEGIGAKTSKRLAAAIQALVLNNGQLKSFADVRGMLQRLWMASSSDSLGPSQGGVGVKAGPAPGAPLSQLGNPEDRKLRIFDDLPGGQRGYPVRSAPEAPVSSSLVNSQFLCSDPSFTKNYQTNPNFGYPAQPESLDDIGLAPLGPPPKIVSLPVISLSDQSPQKPSVDPLASPNPGHMRSPFSSATNQPSPVRPNVSPENRSRVLSTPVNPLQFSMGPNFGSNKAPEPVPAPAPAPQQLPPWIEKTTSAPNKASEPVPAAQQWPPRIDHPNPSPDSGSQLSLDRKSSANDGSGASLQKRTSLLAKPIMNSTENPGFLFVNGVDPSNVNMTTYFQRRGSGLEGNTLEGIVTTQSNDFFDTSVDENEGFFANSLNPQTSNPELKADQLTASQEQGPDPQAGLAQKGTRSPELGGVEDDNKGATKSQNLIPNQNQNFNDPQKRVATITIKWIDERKGMLKVVEYEDKTTAQFELTEEEKFKFIPGYTPTQPAPQPAPTPMLIQPYVPPGVAGPEKDQKDSHMNYYVPNPTANQMSNAPFGSTVNYSFATLLVNPQGTENNILLFRSKPLVTNPRFKELSDLYVNRNHPLMPSKYHNVELSGPNFGVKLNERSVQDANHIRREEYSTPGNMQNLPPAVSKPSTVLSSNAYLIKRV